MKSVNDIKILVFTVDCWNNETGANTMSSLFSWCKPENLANIYIRPGYPSFEGCGAYFQINEKSVVKSIINRKIKTGNRVEADNHLIDASAVNNIIYKLRKHRPWIRLYIREMLWRIGRWKSRELEEFLLEFRPDVIIFAYEGLIHFNRIVRYSVEYTGAKAIGYFWDDNFTYKQMPGNVGYYFYRFFQRKDIKKSVQLSSANFAITPKTKRECDAFFNIDSVLLTKPVKNSSDVSSRDTQIHEPIRLLYTGNLGIGRLETLKLIAEEILKANTNGHKIILDVYSSTEIPMGLRKKYKDTVVFHGSISQKLIPEIQTHADVLLFIEDIVGKNRKIARLSFSTKITDYLSAGKCILAVADSGIAPLEYLKENNAAICASSQNEIENAIKFLINNTKEIAEYGKRSFNIGMKNHSEKEIIKILHNTIISALN